MSTSDEGYQSVIDGLDGVCESFTLLTRQMKFAEIQRNIEIVSNQSKSQMQMLERLGEKIETLMERNCNLEARVLRQVENEEILERLRGKIETLMEMNWNLEVENTGLKIRYNEEIVVLREHDESGSSSVTDPSQTPSQNPSQTPSLTPSQTLLPRSTSLHRSRVHLHALVRELMVPNRCHPWLALL